MNRSELLLAALAAGDGRAFAPVQLQKALFLLSENISDAITEGDGYNFEPYDFGPFDRSVYLDAEAFEREGRIDISKSSNGRWNVYRATAEGVEQGRAVLEQLSASQQDYVRKVAEWVLAQDFAQLVKSIYKAYPHMREKSIFRG